MRFARCVADSGETLQGTIEGDAFVSDGAARSLSSVRLLPPCLPTKIVCVGRNYREHAREMGNDVPDKPLLFFKPPSALIGSGAPIVYPPQSSHVDYEGELAVVIGRRCRNVPRDRANSVVRGYTILNDVTARDLQQTDGQWARAKGFDTFAPLGPCIADGLDPERLRIRTWLNGELRQDASTEALIFDVPALIEFISAAFTLEPDDVIATGTPGGIGLMRPGDEVRVEIDGIGTLANAVRAS